MSYNNGTLIEGAITCTFVMGGISQKGNPYLSVSDGIAPKFITLPKGFDATLLADLSRGDEITMNVVVDPFANRITFVDFVD